MWFGTEVMLILIYRVMRCYLFPVLMGKWYKNEKMNIKIMNLANADILKSVFIYTFPFVQCERKKVLRLDHKIWCHTFLMRKFASATFNHEK